MVPILKLHDGMNKRLLGAAVFSFSVLRFVSSVNKLSNHVIGVIKKKNRFTTKRLLYSTKIAKQEK